MCSFLKARCCVYRYNLNDYIVIAILRNLSIYMHAVRNKSSSVAIAFIYRQRPAHKKEKIVKQLRQLCAKDSEIKTKGRGFCLALS